MCISIQLQQSSEEAIDSGIVSEEIIVFRERSVQCLNLGQYTRGGDHILEAMIQYCTVEVFLCEGADIGLWLLLGTIVQLAISQGYHRDPSNFPNLSPFKAEMRRRVWAAIVQIDVRLSSQMGLPRVLKSQLHDTAEPLNLFDSDFDESTVDFPPPRPETEVTPVLYGIAKNRIDRVGILISDLVADTCEHPYREIVDLSWQLRQAESSLPPIFAWKPGSQSLMLPPPIMLCRIWLQLTVQRLFLWLHRRYLAPTYNQTDYGESRDACVAAAIQILELQQVIEEEMRPGGLLRPVRWMQSSIIQPTFLLGMSVLCYYMQLTKTAADVPLTDPMRSKILGLLRNTYPIWLRSSAVSRDACRAVEYLRQLPALRSPDQDGVMQGGSAEIGSTIVDAPTAMDEVTLSAYQGTEDISA